LLFVRIWIHRIGVLTNEDPPEAGWSGDQRQAEAGSPALPSRRDMVYSSHNFYQTLSRRKERGKFTLD